MAYLGSNATLTAYMAALAADDWSPFVVSPDTVDDRILFRKGPQYSVNLGTRAALVLVGYAGMPGGEETHGISNKMRYRWSLEVLLLVPDNIDDPDTAEDTRLDLIDSYATFVQTTRGVAGANRHQIREVEHLAQQMFAQPETIFRGARLGVELSYTRSEPSVS